jgi:hypothetical protein
MQNANKTRGMGPLGSSGVIAQWGASSCIESIQEVIVSGFGVSSASNTATIASVDMNRSICVPTHGVNYTNDDGSLGPGYTLARISLTNATTVTGQNYAAGSPYGNAVSGLIVSFRPGIVKSIQRGTVSGSATTINLTLSAVNRNKTIVLIGGVNAQTLGNWAVATGAMREFGCIGSWTSDTNFQFAKASGSYTTHLSYEVIEFF